MRAVPILALFLAAPGFFQGFVCAQPATSSPRFESVAIKPGKSPKFQPTDAFGEHLPQEPDGCTGGPETPDPGRLSCNVSLATFLELGFNLGPLQFTPPEWMESSWWDIEAKIPAGATRQEVRSMEQGLLADRFKLAAHFVKRDVEAYEMTVSKDGPKFKPWDPDIAAAAPDRARIRTAANTRLVQDHTYKDTSSCQSPDRHLRGDLSMRELARFLTYPDLRLDQPVLDETGLTGFYDIMLDYAARWRGQVGGEIGPSGAVGGSGVCLEQAHPPSPPLIEAVHQQLGLVLELTRNTVDVLVVDHAEKKPTKN